MLPRMDEETVRRIVREELVALQEAAEGQREQRRVEAALARAARAAREEQEAAERAALEADTYSAKEVADILRVSVDTIRKCAQRGDPEVPAIRVGREWRFPKDEFLKRAWNNPKYQ